MDRDDDDLPRHIVKSLPRPVYAESKPPVFVRIAAKAVTLPQPEAQVPRVRQAAGPHRSLLLAALLSHRATAMILAMRLFFVALLILAYCEDRYLGHDLTVLLAFIAWLGVYYAGQRTKRRR